MLYSEESLAQLSSFKEKWLSEADDLSHKYVIRVYKYDSSSEYARHGLSRRIEKLIHLVERIFELIPPETTKRPRPRVLHDVEAFLQSFLVNIYGAIDNMARIWCIESEVRNQKGAPIADRMIGFGPNNTIVRNSLPPEFLDYLISLDAWFSYLENYRHAVAHRIPVYIPPKTLFGGDVEKFLRIEEEINEAIRNEAVYKLGILSKQQDQLGQFVPAMMHSYREKARAVQFHTQIICDIATITEVGQRLISSLPATST